MSCIFPLRVCLSVNHQGIRFDRVQALTLAVERVHLVLGNRTVADKVVDDRQGLHLHVIV